MSKRKPRNPGEESASSTVRGDLRDYGLYTIKNRAIPDIRDGLKPVQRLILWSLWLLKRTSKDIPAKCAQVATHTTGNFHPHGEGACYDALVKLRWQRYPLVVGAGNFGNPNKIIDPGPAAMRYPETKMQEISERFFDDIHVADMEPNYTSELQQPIVLPARIPTLLVNGGEGIALGIATKLPPHNLQEVLNAAEVLLDNPDATLDDLLQHIKGPDTGTGVLLSKKKDLKQLYETGRGKIDFCCSYVIEEGRKGTKQLVITGKAPEFNGARFLKETVALRDKKLIIAPANDDSSLETGTRITVEYKNPSVVRDRLLPLLRTSVNYQLYALDTKGNPRLCDLKYMLQSWLKFRRVVEKRVLKARRTDLIKKIATEDVRQKAILQIEAVIDIVKKAKSKESALQQLSKKLDVETWQSEVIWNTSLGSLSRMNLKDVKEKISKLKAELKEVKAGLRDIDSVVRRRIQEIKDKYKDQRGTKLRAATDGLAVEEGSDYHVCISPDGKIEMSSELPLKSKAKWSFVNAVRSSDYLVVVWDNNSVERASLSYLDKMEPNKHAKVIGLASEKHSGIFVVSKRGKYVYFSPQQKRNSFTAFRKLDSEDAPFQAVGVREGDSILVIFEDGSCETLSDLSMTRPNVQPKSIRRKKGKVAQVIVRRPGDVFVGPRSFEEVSPSSVGRRKAWLVGKNNIVIDSKGTRKLMTQDQLLEAGKKAKPKLIIPVDAEE